MNAEQTKALHIEAIYKKRPQRSVLLTVLVVALIVGAAGFFAWPRAEDNRRLADSGKGLAAAAPSEDARPARVSGGAKRGDAVLTVNGYIVNHERIELSPRFMGVVNWIGVKKGDAVTNGQVVVLLDDAEYRAQLRQAEGRLANAQVAVEKARLIYERIAKLATDNVESKQSEDDARLNLAAARATVKEVEGQTALIKTYLDWTVIRSPLNGVVLEKLVEPNELVVPQSFGGTRGPSTALISLADLNDLQVEIDLNEADLSKVFPAQECRVSPEAYPDKTYSGYVAEIAPEANRQKGTLQVKVQIRKPDRFLTPELTARVDFLKHPPPQK